MVPIFAVKVLHKRHLASPYGGMRFKREARAAGALHSEHVVSVIDCGNTDDDTPFIVMEYLEGQSLRTLLKREGRLAPVRAVNLVYDACQGVAVAHEAGIIHRDLKPENLFVTRRRSGEELVKVLDYGIAKLMGDAAAELETRSGDGIGTPSYMPPEQATGAAAVDQRADVYALGVILFEALAGVRPQDSPTDNAGTSERSNTASADLGRLCTEAPPGLLRVVTRALSTCPEDRFPSADELARALLPFAGRRAAHRGAPVLDGVNTRSDTEPEPACGTTPVSASRWREPRGKASKGWRRPTIALVGLVLGAAAIAYGATFVGRQRATGGSASTGRPTLATPGSAPNRGEKTPEPVVGEAPTRDGTRSAGSAQADPVTTAEEQVRSTPTGAGPAVAAAAQPAVGSRRPATKQGATSPGPPRRKRPRSAASDPSASVGAGFDRESPYSSQ